MVSGFKENDIMTENYDVAILPYDKETGVRASICNGLGWAAPANTDRADDSWALIEWFGSEEMQKKQKTDETNKGINCNRSAMYDHIFAFCFPV